MNERASLHPISLRVTFEEKSVRIEVFEKALADVEERLGLTGQPRIVVFHEKEGRRHCHAVWSRIDAETMKAKELPHFGLKLKSLAKQIFLENGWNMPRGYESARLRDPRSFSLDEWQRPNVQTSIRAS